MPISWMQICIFECQQCGKQYKTFTTLKRHLVHECGQYVCDKCDRRYKYSQSLRLHQRVKCGKERTIFCPLCSTGFWHKQGLQKHLKHKTCFIPKRTLFTKFSIQNNTLCYNCDQCKRIYKYRNNLRRHLKYECNKEPAFNCPYCTYMCTRKYTLCRHVKRNHQSLNTDIVNFRYKKHTNR
ncbi:hypothetical protein ABEB36_001061 [Hypothenemus hampei]|uniref:C2H2-type domain-containing protein n=1 Tax=Hypothenemus hampei TaxID=57062 RepID=A0ABD1FDB7_HYPHA